MIYTVPTCVAHEVEPWMSVGQSFLLSLAGKIGSGQDQIDACRTITYRCTKCGQLFAADPVPGSWGEKS